MFEAKNRVQPAAAMSPGAQQAFTRRRAFRVLAAAAGMPLLIAGLRATAPDLQAFRWRGQVLGALSELTLWHRDARFASATLVKAREEIARFERIFSLYRPDSEISRLNRTGRLVKPSKELVKLVGESQHLAKASGGAFDITVQPLWQLYAAHFWSRTEVQPDVAARAKDVARALVDYRQIDNDPSAIAFRSPGMAMTLNGMAQGFITDTVSELLRNEGFESAVVDLGEFRTLGHHPEGRPFRLGIRSAGVESTLQRTLELEDMALAVSGGYGTMFEDSGQFHHIFEPQTGSSANTLKSAAVAGPQAAIADGLATAICAGGEALVPTLLAAYPGTRAWLTRPDGSTAHYTANGLAGV